MLRRCGWRWWLQSFYRLIPTAVNGFLTPFALKVVIRYVQADPRPGPIPRGVLVRAETENPGEARPEYVFKVLSLAQNEVFSARSSRPRAHVGFRDLRRSLGLDLSHQRSVHPTDRGSIVSRERRGFRAQVLVAAAAVTLLPIVGVVGDTHNVKVGRRLGLRARGYLTACVLETLASSPAADAGAVTNLVSVDANNVVNYMVQGQLLWAAVLQLALNVALLLDVLGVAGLVGVAVFFSSRVGKRTDARAERAFPQKKKS